MKRLLAIWLVLWGINSSLKAQCSATFSVPDSVVCFGDSISFTFTGNGSIFLWDFDDPVAGSANFSAQANPLHLFTDKGLFKVRLIVNDTNACADTFTREIRVLERPKVNFSLEDNCLGLTSLLKAKIQLDPFDTAGYLQWKVGNQVQDSLLEWSYTFQDTGLVNISLFYRSGFACRDTFEKQVRVYPLPIMRAQPQKNCVNADIEFSILSGLPAATPQFLWQFGDGSSSAQATPTHSYNTEGFYAFQAKLRFADSTSCTTLPDSVEIIPLPSANFTLLTDSVQCFKGHSFCFALSGANEGYLFRSLTFGDGNRFLASDSNTFICHSYIDTSERRYTLTYEVTDQFGCSNVKTVKDMVKVNRIFRPAFANYNVNACFSYTHNFSNRSNFPPSAIKRFKWDFGDGNSDSSNWQPAHTYTTEGSFSSYLWAENTDGCSDTFFSGSRVNLTIIEINASEKTPSSRCLIGNQFHLTHPTRSGAQITWFWGNGDSTLNVFEPKYQYLDTGTYVISVRVRVSNCSKTEVYDTIEIQSPRANVVELAGRTSCTTQVTSYFESSILPWRNQPYEFYWNFGDLYAPACTTDTKNGINVDSNCRFSLDSGKVSHYYSYAGENCYRTTLVVRDLVSGCMSVGALDVAFKKPDAGRDLTSTPIKQGLKLENIRNCLGDDDPRNIFRLNLTQTSPGCTQTRWWVMWDSASAVASGNFDSNWVEIDSNYYTYQAPPVDPNGYVTIGLIIQNGACFDTAWYHKELQFDKINSAFRSDFESTAHYCKSDVIHFYLTDSSAIDMDSVVWIWGDGTRTIVKNNYLQAVPHRYSTSNNFKVDVYAYSKSGCVSYSTMRIPWGVGKSIRFNNNFDFVNACVGDPITFSGSFYYQPSSSNFWDIPQRAANGKETVWFDYGDGNGLVQAKANHTYTYQKAGRYNLTIVVKDSMNCYDTLYWNNRITIGYMDAKITTDRDTFVCEQVVGFKSDITLTDPQGDTTQPISTMVSYKWDYGQGLPQDIVANPFRFLIAGDYNVVLEAVSSLGCVRSATKKVVVIGPLASFNFVSDSVGCQPHPVAFVNNSKNASSFLWRFNDAGSTVLNTSSDTGVSFLYNQAGKFLPSLTATGSFMRNGVPVSCSNTFPNIDREPPREVTVTVSPVASFTYTTNCQTNTTQFTQTATISAGSITSYKWDFGDGKSSTQASPQHIYGDTGRYWVSLTVGSANGCEHTLTQEVVIAPKPIPHFLYTPACAGDSIRFLDNSTTFNDIVRTYDWKFGNGLSSSLKNPATVYSSGGFYTVTLVVTNRAGCMDSISLPVRAYTLPKADFSWNHNCERADIVLQNSSTNADTTLRYLWIFGDGGNTNQEKPFKSFANEGTYSLTLKAISDYGCRDSLSRSITIQPGPVAAFTVDKSGKCLREQDFQFNNQSTVSSGSFNSLWRFGDGQSNTATNPQHTYGQPGSYAVILVVTAPSGCADTVQKTVDVWSHPQAVFSIDKPQQCFRNNAFLFTDGSSAAVQKQWFIEGSNRGSSDNLSFSFSDTGILPVRLSVRSTEGCTDTLIRWVEVVPMPRAIIGTNQSGQCVNQQQFIFSDQSQAVKYGFQSREWMTVGGQTGNGPQFSPVYANEGTYTVRLSVETQVGCRDTITENIVVFPKPSVSFTINDTAQCQFDNQYVFTETGSITSGNRQFSWYLGDGNIANGNTINHRYKITGNPLVTLIVSSDKGCVDSSSQRVRLHRKPQAQIMVNQSAQCINPNAFVWNSGAAGTPIASFNWELPSENIRSLQTVTDTFLYSFTSHGSFPVLLELVSDKGCRDTTQSQVVVHPKPSAMFSLNDTDQCVNQQLFIFSNQSTIPSGTLSYTWITGDGNLFNQSALTHQYASFGSYTATLIASSNFNCLDTIEKDIIVYPAPRPAFVTPESAQCFVDNKFVFNNASTIPYGTMDYIWDFGDNQQDSIEDATHSYAGYGMYRVVLTAISEFGCKDTAGQLVRVHPKPNPAFSFNKQQQCMNENHFVASANSTIPEGSISHEWKLNGGIQYGNLAFAKYDKKGLHPITLYSISAVGCVDSLTQEVRVWASPEAAFSPNNPNQCLKTQDFQFINQSQITEGKLDSAYWLFEGMIADSSWNSTHKFGTTGVFDVRMIAVSDSGCRDTVLQKITVYPMPQALFSIDDSSQCLNTNLFFTRNFSIDSLSILESEWKVADRPSIFENEINFHLNDTGYHTIRLSVLSELGCRDTIFREVFVKPLPDASFEKLSPFYCNNSEPLTFLPTTPGGIFYGKNFVQDRYQPQQLWRDTLFYKVTVEGCTDSTSQITNVYPAPVVDLGTDTMLCQKEMIAFDVSFWNSSYEWQDRSKEAKYLVKREGLYSVTVRNFCGSSRDSVYISYGNYNCRLFLPNAFSPNKDGLNDVYAPITYDLLRYEIFIYNGWGQLVFKGNQNQAGWDGTFNGKDCPQGVYVVRVNYAYDFQGAEVKQEEAVSLHLIR